MIYFARNRKTGYIKIGTSENVLQRVQQLTGQFGKVDLLGVIPGGRPFEHALHMAFDAYLVPGMGREWFFYAEPLQKYIKRYAKPVNNFRQPIPLEPPTVFRDGVNCHLFDLIIKKRQESGFYNFGIDDLAVATGVDAKRLQVMVKNEAEIFYTADTDALVEFFGCQYGDFLKLGKPFPELANNS